MPKLGNMLYIVYMARKCNVCKHPSRARIERNFAKNKKLREISQEFGVSEDSIRRHKAHMRNAVERAEEITIIRHGTSLQDQLLKLHKKSLRHIKTAENYLSLIDPTHKDYGNRLQILSHITM